MNERERVYSVLVVSAATNLNAALGDLLPAARYSPVHTVTSVSAARRAIAERAFDFVLLNSPLPDDAGIRFAIDLCTAGSTVVLLLIRSELHEEVYSKVSEHGVFTLPKPTSKLTLTTALSWMATARDRLRRFEKKNLSVENKMEEIRLVNRAKWLLITELKMDEPAAHRYIEKQAMDRCTSKRAVASEIIKTYS